MTNVEICSKKETLQGTVRSIWTKILCLHAKYVQRLLTEGIICTHMLSNAMMSHCHRSNTNVMTVRKRYLKQHMDTHTAAPRKQCKYCEKDFTAKTNLQAILSCVTHFNRNNLKFQFCSPNRYNVPFKCVFNLLASHEAYSHWLHLFDLHCATTASQGVL